MHDRAFHRFLLFVASATVWAATAWNATAQVPFGLPGAAGSSADDEPVKISAQFTAAAAGQPSRLFVTAKIAPRWHMYSVTQPKQGPKPTVIKLDIDQPAAISGAFQPNVAPTKHNEPMFDNAVVEQHEKLVTWYANLQWSADANPSAATLEGTVNFLVCKDTSCLPQNISFTAKLGPGIPIDAPAAPAQAQANNTPATPAKLVIYRDPGAHVNLTGRLEAAHVEPGGKVVLHLRAEPIDGYHVYEWKAAPPLLGNKPTLIRVTSVDGLIPAGLTSDMAPQVKKASDSLRIHKSPVDWTIELVVPRETRTGLHRVEGIIGYQTCLGDLSCDSPTAAKFSAIIQVGGQGEGSGEIQFVAAKYPEAELAANTLPPLVIAGEQNEMPPAHVSGEPAVSLAVMLGSALLGGLILNLMPCVLPVIGLKIFSFMEQAGESRRTALALNLWYTAGLLSVFMVLATAATAANLGLAKTNLGWGEQFASTPFNITMASIVFVMALSFLGIWEIPIPGFAGSGKSQDLASREGALGAFSKGAVTTLLATPCSGPFLGSVFGFTLSQPPQITYLLFFCIGLGMASPYLLIGAFPSLIRFLPKPGAWMETFKQAMGFLLLGGVVFVFTFLKPVYVVPTFALLIGLWAGCWWIGRTPLYESAGKIAKAYVIGGIVAVTIGTMSFQWLVPGAQVIAWQPYSEQRLAELTSQGNTVMVDFSAEWCLTCKTNLKFSINRPEVARMVEQGHVVPMLADWTDGSEEIKQALAKLGSASIPVLAIYPANRPTEPIVLKDLLTQQQVLDALKKAGPSASSKNAQR